MIKFNIVPISVQQRVLAIHPQTYELRTAKILTSAAQVTNGNKTDSLQYRSQFDRSELGVPYIKDTNVIPIGSHGANWDLIKMKNNGNLKD